MKTPRWNDIAMLALAMVLSICCCLGFAFVNSGQRRCRRLGELAGVETCYMNDYNCFIRMGDFLVPWVEPTPEAIRERFRNRQYLWAPLPDKTPGLRQPWTKQRLIKRRVEGLRRYLNAR